MTCIWLVSQQRRRCLQLSERASSNKRRPTTATNNHNALCLHTTSRYVEAGLKTKRSCSCRFCGWVHGCKQTEQGITLFGGPGRPTSAYGIKLGAEVGNKLLLLHIGFDELLDARLYN